jgi:hypothetical protein
MNDSLEHAHLTADDILEEGEVKPDAPEEGTAQPEGDEKQAAAQEPEKQEPEEGELRKYGDIYVEDVNEKLFRRVVFQSAASDEELEVILYRLGYIDMISVNGCSVPLQDFLSIEYLGYWEQDWISMHLKSKHIIQIPRISNDMLIQCLSYISRYPYEIPDNSDEESSDGDVCLSASLVLLSVAAVALWFYYLFVGSWRIHAAEQLRDEL